MHRSSKSGLWSLFIVAASVFPRAGVGQAQTQNPITVSASVYAQYGYAIKDTAHLNSFAVTRAYLNVIGRFSDGLYTRVTGDIYTNADSSRSYRLKYAYFAWTPKGSPLSYKLGLIHTPFLDWEEALWDYRMQGTTVMDRNGYMSSADFGGGVDGKWGADKVNMQVTVVNGENYNKGTGDRHKDAEGRVSFRLRDTDDSSRVGGLRLTGYAQYGQPTGGGTRQRYIGMLSYRSKAFTLAGEYALTKDSVAAAAMLDGQVASVFGVLHFSGGSSPLALIGRVDYVKPDKNAGTAVTGYSNTRYIGGVSYQATPNLRLLGDVDWVTYRNGAPTAALQASRAQALFQTQFSF